MSGIYNTINKGEIEHPYFEYARKHINRASIATFGLIVGTGIAMITMMSENYLAGGVASLGALAGIVLDGRTTRRFNELEDLENKLIQAGRK